MRRLLQVIFLLVLFSCDTNKLEKTHETLYLTTNSNDVYAFNIQNKKMKWHHPSFNSEVNSGLSFFTVNEKLLTKSYRDGTLLQLDKFSGELLHKFQDKEDETHSYYGYDFTDVGFLHIGQYPQMYQNSAVFGNTHGKIKSINIQSKKRNWIYIQNQIIYSSPKIVRNIVYVNLNYEIIALDAKTGKKLYKAKLEEVSSNELIIDEEKIYILGEYNTLACYNLKLEKQWSLTVQETNQTHTQNLLITKEFIYFGGNIVYSVDKKTGKLNWKCLLPDENNLHTIVESKNDIIVLTNKNFIKINDDGKIIADKKCTETPIGKLFYCNNLLYYFTETGNIKTIDINLKNEDLFYKGIEMDPNYEVNNTYFYSD